MILRILIELMPYELLALPTSLQVPYEPLALFFMHIYFETSFLKFLITIGMCVSLLVDDIIIYYVVISITVHPRLDFPYI